MKVESAEACGVLGSLLVLGRPLEVHGNPWNPFGILLEIHGDPWNHFGLYGQWKPKCFGHGRRKKCVLRRVFKGGFQKACKLQ